jgi:hypothetical protein
MELPVGRPLGYGDLTRPHDPHARTSDTVGMPMSQQIVDDPAGAPADDRDVTWSVTVLLEESTWNEFEVQAASYDYMQSGSPEHAVWEWYNAKGNTVLIVPANRLVTAHCPDGSSQA